MYTRSGLATVPRRSDGSLASQPIYRKVCVGDYLNLLWALEMRPYALSADIKLAAAVCAA